MNEEVLRLIAESPDGLKAFESWMTLQWAEFIFAGLLVTLVVGGVVGFICWVIKNGFRR